MLIVASVKQVLSGDTLVASGANGATLTLTLTGLKAPRFPQPPRSSAAAATTAVDEPFGLESREFLRSLVNSSTRKICFVINHKDPANAEHVWVTLWADRAQPGAMDESANALVARAGWARVKDQDLKLQQHAELADAVRRGSQQAQDASRGVFHPAAQNVAKRVQWDFPADHFQQYADRLVAQRTARALVEYCRDACTFRALLLDSNIMVWFTLAGVVGVRKPASALVNQDSLVVQEDLLAQESKRFSETRLLQREVVLCVGGSDAGARAVYGTVLHPSGKCITQELVKQGLAKVVDWSVALLPPGEGTTDGPTLRALQREAQLGQRGWWKGFVVKTVQSSTVTVLLDSFEGVVTEVLSGDTLCVRLANRGEERRVSLSSVLAPRFQHPQQQRRGGGGTAAPAGEALGPESRDYVRRAFQGAKVTVQVDYVREPKEGSQLPPRAYATVLVLHMPAGAQKTAPSASLPVNVGVEVVRQGLAQVAQHRQDDADRSPHYDALLAAQQHAKQHKLGVNSANAPTVRLQFGPADDNKSNQSARSRQHLQRLPPGQLHRCAVEWVVSATRVCLDLPDENALLTSFSLLGVAAPQIKLNEPFAKEALEFTRAQVFTPGLRASVDAVDRQGGFLGSLFVKGEFNVAYALLERGLARVHSPSADASTTPAAHRAELYARERRAKDGRLGVWKDFVEPVVVDDNDDDNDNNHHPQGVFRECRVSEVQCGDRVFVQFNGPVEAAARQQIAAELDKVEREAAITQTGSLSSSSSSSWRRGQLVAAHDGTKWLRARVLSTGSTMAVAFVDFGHEMTLSASEHKVRALPSSLQLLAPLAVEKRLAFVRCRALGQDYAREAAQFLEDFCWGEQQDDKDGDDEDMLSACDTKFGLLLRRGRHQLANVQLVQAGLAFVKQKDQARFLNSDDTQHSASLLQAHYHDVKQAQRVARDKRRCMWAFGDPGDEDDE